MLALLFLTIAVAEAGQTLDRCAQFTAQLLAKAVQKFTTVRAEGALIEGGDWRWGEIRTWPDHHFQAAQIGHAALAQRLQYLGPLEAGPLQPAAAADMQQ